MGVGLEVFRAQRAVLEFGGESRVGAHP
jgi:hypothetical protein